MPLRLLEDNQATIKVVENGFSAKLRHMSRVHGVDVSSIKEIIDKEGVSLEYCRTDDMAADLFTKALAPQKWANALELIGMTTHRIDVMKGG